ncbi:cytochrome P450 306a1-like isoform X2 [Zophobas morio]|uniref:cytochrome P450 306a1-like isoform X2 n=1 Tax=Zophobas morio TaxID=2755281 RepID=UPI003082E2D6
MATTVVVLIIIIILLLLVKIFHDKETLPGPWNLPVIGYLHKLDPIAPYLTLTKLAQKYGPIYSIKIGMVKVVVIADAKLLKKVLSKDETLIRPSLYLINTSFEHKGMSHAPIDVWKDQRKFVANFLRTVGAAKVSPNKKACEKLIRKHVDEFVQVVQNQAFCQPLDPSELITHLVSSTASSIYLGKPFSLNDTKVADLAQNVHVFTKLIMFGAPLNFLPVLRFLPPYKNKLKSLKKAVRRVHEIQATLIDECEKSTCVDSRLNLVNAFQLQISEAQYPEVQNKMRQELYHVVQDKTVQVDDFANLHYIRATIAEVARNRTLIPLGIPHSVSEKICVDGFTIPKGVMIMPLLWAIHMDPKFHKEPEEFHPERFLDSDGKFSKPESFLPFQSGKRKCIGEDVAEIMTSIFIAGVLQNFRIEQVDSTPLDFTGICGVTLAPKPQKLIFSKI